MRVQFVILAYYHCRMWRSLPVKRNDLVIQHRSKNYDFKYGNSINQITRLKILPGSSFVNVIGFDGLKTFLFLTHWLSVFECLYFVLKTKRHPFRTTPRAAKNI
ncbi:hypothetical protein ACJX0J_005464 [Zea mays]